MTAVNTIETASPAVADVSLKGKLRRQEGELFSELVRSLHAAVLQTLSKV